MIEERADGRSVLREQRHVAILAAVRRLATGSGPEGFTVDQVAAEAGVSRRTVFNHFATLETLLVAVCEQILQEVTQQVLDRLGAHLKQDARGRTPAVQALDSLCAAIQDADLPLVMTEIVGTLNGAAQGTPSSEAISRTALDQVGSRLAALAGAHAPDLDRVVLRLTIAFLMHGISLIAHDWVEEFDGRVTAQSRRSWDASMTALVSQLAYGYREVAQPAG